MPAKIAKDAWEKRLRSFSHIKLMSWEGECVGAKSRVKVRCCENTDHSWVTSIASLMAGGGCPACAKISKSLKCRSATAEIEASLSNLEGMEFLGWITEHVNCSSKAKMKCKVHDFSWAASVSNLLYRKSGCPKCGGVYKYTRSEAEAAIEENWPSRFNGWLNGVYENASSRAVMVCPNGHEYTSKASKLINRQDGCMECTGRKRVSRSVREAQLSKIVGAKFIKWDGVYRNQKSKAVMKCETCSKEWSSTVNCLVDSGSRCPSCAKYGFDSSESGTLYVLRSADGLSVKFGISNDVRRRLIDLRRETPFEFDPIEMIDFEKGRDARALEREAHSKFESAGFSGFDGATEWVMFSQALLEWLFDKRKVLNK